MLENYVVKTLNHEMGHTGHFTTVAWIPRYGLSEHDWRQLGEHLKMLQTSRTWWIGDWWVHGNHRYGDRKAIVESPHWRGPSFNVCMNSAIVAKAFETSRRREVLSFAHHAELAKARLPKADADALLDEAIKGGWPSLWLRERAREFLAKPLVTTPDIDIEQLRQQVTAKFAKWGRSARGQCAQICKRGDAQLLTKVLHGTMSLNSAHASLEPRVPNNLVEMPPRPSHADVVRVQTINLLQALQLITEFEESHVGAHVARTAMTPAEQATVEVQIRGCVRTLEIVKAIWIRLKEAPHAHKHGTR